MIYKCTNSNCNNEKEIHRVRIVLDEKGNKKQDDTICDQCGSKMEDKEHTPDYSSVRMKKPTSDKSRHFYTRGKGRNGK